MTALTAFFPYVLPNVPGCPQFSARDAIRLAAVDFCTTTRCWQVTQPPIDSVAGTAEYTIPAPTDGQAVQIEWLRYDGELLTPITEASLDNAFPHWATEQGTPTCYLQKDPLTVALVKTPDTSLADAIWLRASYCPTPAASVVPDVLYARDRETIGHGAVWRLLSAPGKTWSNPELAAVHLQYFQSGMGRAALRVAKGYGRASLRTVTVARVG